MSSSTQTAKTLNSEQIKRIIPQRFPFLMLDRITMAEPGVRVVGVKNLSANEWFYQGHFPKRAVTPGAMICEAIAQVGIVFFALSKGEGRDVTYLLGGIKIRFLHPAWPGDQLRIEVTPVRVTSNAAILTGEVFVEERLIAKGEFTLAAKPNDEL